MSQFAIKRQKTFPPPCRVAECCPSPKKFTATKSDYILGNGSFICIIQKVRRGLNWMKWRHHWGNNPIEPTCWKILLNTVNKNPTDATVCRYLFTAKLLYMFRVSQHPSPGVLKTVPAASGTGHTTCTATPLQRGLIGSGLCESLVCASWVFNTPDDGCCDTRNM